MKTVVELLKKYQSIIAYLVFGVLTTVVNIAAYFVFYNILGVPNVASTAIAWVIAVIFAFVTNKLWVFDSKSWASKVVLREIATFFAARALTGVMDIAIMWATVDMMHWNAMLWKIISNVLVVILNYVASKLVIFKKK